MKKLILILTVLGILGCTPEPTHRWETDQELRQELFFKCLEKIPKGPSYTKYNDWAEVIEECDSAAYHMAQKKVSKKEAAITVPLGKDM